MRIIGGKHKGRKLFTPEGKGVRPTSAKMRESMFNILMSMNSIEDATVLDLCCGTGSLGIEALSRGCLKVTFIDGSAPHLKLAWANITHVKETDNSTLIRTRAEDLPKAKEQFDLVFIDPPYSKKIADKALISLIERNWLSDNAIFVIEQDRREDLIFSEEHYKETLKRTYGNSKLTLLEKI